LSLLHTRLWGAEGMKLPLTLLLQADLRSMLQRTVPMVRHSRLRLGTLLGAAGKPNLRLEHGVERRARQEGARLRNAVW
jgi:hypothetical protein